ncbi:hypothetical protein AALC17_03865 [Oscillospiraceae bacterium 38-13]
MKDLNAPVWQTLSAAGNDADTWLRRLLAGEVEFREGMEILADDLSHQLSWYSATAYVLPHLAALCGTLSPADQSFLTAQMGAAIAAEAECPLKEGTEIQREFQEGLTALRPVVAGLIQHHMDVLTAAPADERQMFALSALAVLGDRKHAYGLWYLSGSCWEEGPAACSCGWEDECVPLPSLDPAALSPWDGMALEDEAVWLSGLLSRFGDTQILPVLPLVYGSVVCPECGKRESYWTMMERYLREE